jgi:hypothetical protein
LILSRQSELKNMYADSARLGAFGSFSFLPRAALAGFAAFSAALRWESVSVKVEERGKRVKGRRGGICACIVQEDGAHSSQVRSRKK